MREMTLEDAMCLIKLINVTVKNNYLNDRDAMEEIVRIFTTYDIDCGSRGKELKEFYILRE